MKHYLRQCLLLSMVLMAVQFSIAQTFISKNSSWKYLDDGSNQGTAWRATSFNDVSWASGNAELGYGDGDETTVVSYGGNSSNKYITTYFRKSFNVSNPGSIGSLDAELLCDDGAVVFLNGTEIFRQNMPTGTIGYQTTANGAIGGSSESAYTSYNSISSSNLVSGTNVISVEIHQANNSSSDISFNFELSAGVPPGTPTIERGPYLQKGTPTSMVIKWRTNNSSDSKVSYGTSLGSLTQSETDATSTTEHEIEITGLSPNTKYYYSVGTSTTVLQGGTSSYYFQTSPILGTVQPITAWIIGDPGTANNNQRAVRNAYYNYIGTDHTDLLIMLGDNAYNDGLDNEYQNAMFENMYEDLLQKTVTWPTPGNHDYYGVDHLSSYQFLAPYYDIFTLPTAAEAGGVASGTEAYYSFDYGNIHFISLDSHEENRAVGGNMYNWMINDLANTTQKWIVAFWHHPPYSKGSHNSDTESRMIQMRTNFLPKLEEYGVDLVFTGHSHCYERSHLIKGHYGTSNTYNTSTMRLDGGDGNVSGDGAYEKEVTGPNAGDGAVYIVAGSSGKISSMIGTHPIMEVSQPTLGSVVLEVNGGQMDVKFLNSANPGTIIDHFTIIKEDDWDNDGIADETDVDDDNDGIPDELEKVPYYTYNTNTQNLSTGSENGNAITISNNSILTDNVTSTFTETSINSATFQYNSSGINYTVPASSGSGGTVTMSFSGQPAKDLTFDVTSIDYFTLGAAYEDQLEIVVYENNSATPTVLNGSNFTLSSGCAGLTAGTINTIGLSGCTDPLNASTNVQVALNGLNVTKVELTLSDLTGGNANIGFSVQNISFETTTASVTYVEEDTDLDGILDKLDLDSDGDGIADVIEAGGSDSDFDGMIDQSGSFVDTDQDGLFDPVDDINSGDLSGTGEITSGTPLALSDTDLDTRRNFQDIDSDGDGIVDIIEAQATATYTAPSNLDSDQDGLDDQFDNAFSGRGTASSGTPISPLNTDGIDNPDYLDDDSENDFRLDYMEAYDTDENASINGAEKIVQSSDTDNDGLDDGFDAIDKTTSPQLNATNNDTEPLDFPNSVNIGVEANFREVNKLINAKTFVFMEGPYSSGSMTALLNDQSGTNILATYALQQPFNQSPWNYSGDEEVDASFFADHTSIVDWILIELRDKNDASNILFRRACFITQNGSLIDPKNEGEGVYFDIPSSEDYYIAIRHRNHTDVVSNTIKTFYPGSNNPVTWDIRTSNNDVYSSSMLKSSGTDFMMICGDADGNNDINSNDEAIWLSENGSTPTYSLSDYDCNGDVNANDEAIWLLNNGTVISAP